MKQIAEDTIDLLDKYLHKSSTTLIVGAVPPCLPLLQGQPQGDCPCHAKALLQNICSGAYIHSRVREKRRLRLRDVCVAAGDEIVGVINIGYGDPTNDEIMLLELAARFEVEIKDIRNRAATYKSRPPYSRRMVLSSVTSCISSTARVPSQTFLGTSQIF